MPSDLTSVTVPSGLDWQTSVAETLANCEVSVAAYVPDSRLHGILEQLRELGITLRSLTREEECVAYAAGRRLAGGRAVVLMQSSGLGNAINALATLAVPSRLGLPIVVSMRGTVGEANPSQIPMGRATPDLLAAIGIQSFSLRRAEHAQEVTSGICTMAFRARECAAMMLEPELGGGREVN